MKKLILIIYTLFSLSTIYAQQNKKGLYVGDTFQGEMDLYDALDWITLNAVEGEEYSIVLSDNLAASSNVLDCNGKSVTISLKSSGSEIQLSYATRSPSSSLFTVKKGVTFVLENGVSLIGRSTASRPPVTVDGGIFIMNGGGIRDSKVDHSESWYGGGVDILSNGTFIMNAGKISGNSAPAGGAGVYVSENATFVMNGGNIGNNYTKEFGRGGGVSVRGSFAMFGGSISNNSGRKDLNWGGGVYIANGGTFVLHDGTISNNSGGGICIDGEKNFFGSSGGNATMNGGTISSNSVSRIGGGWSVCKRFVYHE